MARPKKCKIVCNEPSYDCFVPDGVLVSGSCVLSVEEYEVIRLIDYERLTQEECAMQMGVGRTTITDMYDKAHYKIADCIINGKKIIIDGGNYEICKGNPFCHKKDLCCRKNQENKIIIRKKGDNQMRVAVTYENGEIFQHFGHTEQFKLYDIEAGEIINEQVVDTNGQGHGALAGFLFGGQVDTLICGGIGGGAKAALAEAGIKLYGGVSGNADAAVKALIEGKLDYNPDVHCDHHDHEHGEENHHCGEHGCGSHSCH